MDPTGLVDLLAQGAALAAGGAGEGLKDVAKAAVGDAYAACKRALRGVFSSDEDAKEALSQLEMAPEDARLRTVLIGHVQAHEAAENTGVLEALKVLQASLASAGPVVGTVQGTFKADRGGIAAGVITGTVNAGYNPTREAQDPR